MDKFQTVKINEVKIRAQKFSDPKCKVIRVINALLSL